MTWKVEKAEQQGDWAVITIKHVLADGTDEVEAKGNLATKTLRHQRTSFDGKQQTLTEWRANIKREVRAMIAVWDSEETVATAQDITAAVR